MCQLTLDSATLETLLKRATSSSRLGSYIDEPTTIAGPLADDLDAIHHGLTELHGNPHLILTSQGARSAIRWGRAAGAALMALVLLGVLVLSLTGGAW